jgi:Spy/CpxP family protein refolding chaperone
MFPMSFFHRFSRHHEHHARHHCGRHGHDDASHIEHLADRISGRLDLNEAQQDKLVSLLESLQAQRAAIRNVDFAKDLGAMIQGERIDRAAAQAWIDQRMQSLQTAAPTVLGALADFYDALDTEQQQALRFMLRMRGGWARRFAGRFGRGH